MESGNKLTSEDEPIRLDPICDTDEGGTLYLTLAPGKKQPATKEGGIDWDRCLHTDLIRIKSEYEIDCIVCLLEHHEFDSLKIYDYPEVVREYNFDIIHYPIRDKDIPENMEKFHELVKNVHGRLHEGQKIAVHCAGGVGRSGTLASTILCRSGIEPFEAIRLVQERRLNSIKRPSQQNFVCQYYYYYC